MGEFFKGWRRKVGVLTLVVAYVFTAGWVRSHVANDDCTFWFIKQLAVESMVDTFVISIHYHVAPYGPRWATGKPFEINFPDSGVNSGVNSGGGCNILETLGVAVESNDQSASLFVPYWAIVLPLTLLAAYLLLIKPRTRRPNNCRGSVNHA